MQDFSGFLNLFFNSQFFSVLIVILIMILITILMFLIKSQKNQIKVLEEKIGKSSETILSINEPIKVSNLVEVSSKTENSSTIKPEEIVTETIEDIIKINPIEEYELNEEENAVISTKELEAIEKERDETLGKENNEKLIEQYEKDQEKKAIISYNELLKNASSLELNYIEKPKEEMSAPLVKQVEIKEQPLKGVTYAAEEEYLKLLKEFKASLISSV